MRHAYKILVGKLKEKTPFLKYMCRWEDNIKPNLNETTCDDD